MKDSGVEWLGEVPADWKVLSLKRIGRLKGGSGFPPSLQGRAENEIPFFKVGDLGKSPDGKYLGDTEHTITHGEAKELGATVFPANVLVWAKIGAALSLNRRRITTKPSCLDNNMTGFVPDTMLVSTRYSFYLMSSVDFTVHAKPGAVPSFSEGDQGELQISLPPRRFQDAIVAHLDRATSRIDTLVAKKTRFIELLREKRQALITHTVTKGLDPSVPMKDSGVEWLGEVPETWDAAPLKSFLQLRRDIVGSESSNTKLLSLTLQGVIERDLENPTGKMPASFDGYQRISAGEMVFCLFDMDETPRTVGVAPQDGMLTGAYTVFRPQSELWARYLYYFFLHVDEYKRLRPFYKGLRKTIRPGPFLSIQVPRPTEREAKAIVAHLDRVTSRIDTLIAKTERSIELLREHRTALITAAVTGKIDLRATA